MSTRVSRASWASDRAAAVDLVSHLCGSDEELDAYVKLLEIRARQLAQGPALRPALDALVETLLERRRLSGREARRIMRDALCVH